MIPFTKMQGIGNDFVVVDARHANSVDSQSLCRHRFGVGADGLLIVGSGGGVNSLTFRMFNPDGSEDMCGNGLRCAVLWAYRQGMVEAGGDITVHGFDRDRTCRLLDVSSDSNCGTVSVDMGSADFTLEHIPFLGKQAALEIAGRNIAITPVNTGSAHAVVFLDSDLGDADFELLSPLIENHPDFPERTSIMWTVPEPFDHYHVRIWERAVGETLGCGTGATAIAAVAWAQNRTPSDHLVTVRSRGGELRLTQNAAGTITMTGPAEWVFDGSTP